VRKYIALKQNGRNKVDIRIPFGVVLRCVFVVAEVVDSVVDDVVDDAVRNRYE
jgi:hypothetical protein